jgi:P4 family phage/plasmid primase-like protien
MLPKFTPPEQAYAELTMRDKAKYLMENGFKIVVLYGVNDDGTCACGQNPHDKKLVGKHPVLTSFADKAEKGTLEDIDKWFPANENRNIGIHCELSEVVVIDEDPRNGGFEGSYAMECATEGTIPKTVSVLTGEYFLNGVPVRGTHKFFHHPTGNRVEVKIKSWPGIDIKHNGYVVAPGSKHLSGVSYEWEPGCAPWEIEIATMPELLAGFIVKSGKSSPVTKNSIGNDEWAESFALQLEQDFVTTPYARATMKNIEREVQTAAKGTRNNTINAACFVAGQLIGGGQLSYKEAKAIIQSAAKKNYGASFDAEKEAKVDKVMREFGGGFEFGAMNPRYPNVLTPEQISWAESVSGAATNLDTDELQLQMQKGFFDTRGNLLLDTVIQTLESISQLATGTDKQVWYYEGGYWKRGGDSEVTRNLQVLLGEKARSGHISNVLDYLSARHPQIKDVGDPNFINCKNGMLNWKTGELLPHDPKYFSTYQLEIDWNPLATCPTVEKWLETVVDVSLVELLWEIAGVSVYPGMGFHKGIFLFGPGRNGKGTYLRLLEKLVPRSARTNIDPQRITADRFATAQLFGRVLNICGDISADALRDSSRFKMVTGEDEIPAEFKHKDSFSFTSGATQLFAANEMPISRDKSPGYLSRLLIVPFDKVTLNDDQIDKSLEPRMFLELEGVLVKAVEGLQRAMSRGAFKPSELCKAALDDYARFNGSTNFFVGEMLLPTPGALIGKKELYEEYAKYCESQGIPASNRANFNSTFKNITDGQSIARQISGGIDVYEGFSLKPKDGD